ncbi:hypothetical protein [Chryseobacterium sp. MEBOG07]|uniref:hypothetical protein n=1 Tax=Chryseobacterium sp. MEBOG07 TaxID=2879939 RepID=UPI001F45453B|nr:hypothetical protein [Chryseobacterium sp. MEBOG07]UKB81248.1 hypothetical protein LF886_09735 [Chryseobacterium sp. MEBOG07]
MKYPKLTALLGLQTITIQSGLFGANAHTRLDEEQLQKLEDQLSIHGGDAELQTKFDALQKSFNTLKGEKDGLQSAVTQALELNSLTADLQENATSVQAIELLGTKCKEYGASNNRHNFPKNDGKDKNDVDPDPSENYQHNKILSDRSKFPTLK